MVDTTDMRESIKPQYHKDNHFNPNASWDFIEWKGDPDRCFALLDTSNFPFGIWDVLSCCSCV